MSRSCPEQLVYLETLVRGYFAALDNQRNRRIGLQYKGGVRARMIRAQQIQLPNAEELLNAEDALRAEIGMHIGMQLEKE